MGCEFPTRGIPTGFRRCYNAEGEVCILCTREGTHMALLFLVLTLLIGVGMLWALISTARRGEPQRDPTGGMVFRHGRLLRWFAVFALFGAEGLLAVWAIIYPPQSPRTAVPLFVGAATLGLLGILLCWEAYRYSLTVTPETLDCRSPWRGRMVLPWAGVTRLSFSAVNAWFVLHFVDGRSFRVPAVVPGIQRFLEACERHLSPEQLRPARGGYPLVNRKWPEQSHKAG